MAMVLGTLEEVWEVWRAVGGGFGGMEEDIGEWGGQFGGIVYKVSKQNSERKARTVIGPGC